MQTTSVLDFTMKDIAGAEVSLRSFEERVLLIVNVASKCGLTPQYNGLQTLYERYKEKGFEILAFPANFVANQLAKQEPKVPVFSTVCPRYILTHEALKTTLRLWELWLDDHPEQWNLNAEVLGYRALVAVWLGKSCPPR